jgi:ABC-2 type transport system permease protein
MLGMYLASPLTRESYLLAKVLGVLPVLLLVTLGPELLLLVGRSLVDAGPQSAGEFAIVLVRVIAAGLFLSVLYTAVSLAAASLTDRRAFASAGVILTLLMTAAVTSALVEGADFDHRLYLLNLGLLPGELVFRIFGERGSEPSLETVMLVTAAIVWIAASAAVVVWRYRKLTIAR